MQYKSVLKYSKAIYLWHRIRQVFQTLFLMAQKLVSLGVWGRKYLDNSVSEPEESKYYIVNYIVRSVVSYSISRSESMLERILII